MNIYYVLPFVSRTGGVSIIQRHVGELNARGYRSKIVLPLMYPRIGRDLGRWDGFASWLRLCKQNVITALQYPSANGAPLKVLPVFTRCAFSHHDILIATTWHTAFWVASVQPDPGRRLYFIQGHENWSSNESLLKKSYQLPLRKYVVSEWLAGVLAERYGIQDHIDVVPNAYDHGVFNPHAGERSQVTTVLAQYHPAPIKGPEILMKVFQRLRQNYPGIRLEAFGTVQPCKQFLDLVDLFHLNPSQRKLAALYAGATFFVGTSYEEGWGLPLMEAMACGCVAVTTDNGGCRSFIRPGSNGIIVPQGDWAAIADAVVRVARDASVLGPLRINAAQTIQQFTWERTICDLESVLFGND